MGISINRGVRADTVPRPVIWPPLYAQNRQQQQQDEEEDEEYERRKDDSTDISTEKVSPSSPAPSPASASLFPRPSHPFTPADLAKIPDYVDYRQITLQYVIQQSTWKVRDEVPPSRWGRLPLREQGPELIRITKRDIDRDPTKNGKYKTIYGPNRSVEPGRQLTPSSSSSSSTGETTIAMDEEDQGPSPSSSGEKTVTMDHSSRIRSPSLSPDPNVIWTSVRGNSLKLNAVQLNAVTMSARNVIVAREGPEFQTVRIDTEEKRRKLVFAVVPESGEPNTPQLVMVDDQLHARWDKRRHVLVLRAVPGSSLFR